MNRIDTAFKKSTATPHDAAFKAAFQKKELAKNFFRRYFPKKLVKRIDFRYFKLNNRSYVDEQFKAKHSDIVYRTKIHGNYAFLYILFEHQSTPDYWMAFRLLCYMTNLWREYLDQNSKAGQLPIILPAVLYHGKKPWTAPVAFDEMLGDDEELARYVPRFSYDLYNLSDYPDETLLLGDYMALGVVLYLMKHIFDGDFGDRFVKAAEYLGTIDDQKVQLEFLEWMLRYTYHAREDDREYIDHGVDALNNESARRLAMTIAERIKQEGRLESRMELIQKILNKRFGNISPILEKKLKGSGLDDLYEFEENILDFNNLKDAEKWWDAHEN